jgi:predicted dehydrogenase
VGDRARLPVESTAAPGPVAVGIVGCGAVTGLYYTPALRVLDQEGLVRVAALCDPASDALARIANEFPRAERLSAFGDLLHRGLDLVIVASPPRWHCEQVIALLEAGAAVLCEKPLATNVADAEAMVRAAAKAGRPLAIGLMRRFFPATRTIKAMLEARVIGEIRRFRCFEGGTFGWPVRSSSYFERSTSGGGVLIDLGPHLLDLLLWWLGAPAQVAYEDDAMGGVEANCRLCLSYDGFAGEVRLSRDWHRPNRYVFEGTAGTLAWTAPEADRLDLGWHDAGYGSEVILYEAMPGDAARPGRRAANFEQSFVEQIRQAVAAMRGEPSSIVEGAEALESLRLIEHCYRHRKLLELHWMGEAERRAAQELAVQ